MRMIPKLLLVFSLAGLITACPTQPAAVGKLEVKITGLPSGATPNVTVTGPNAFKQVISSPGSTSNVITDLPVGSYKVAAANVTVNSTSYEPTVTGSPATVTADTTSSVSVVYGIAPINITGKLVSGSGQPITTNSLNGQTLALRVLGSSADIPVDANGGFTVNDVPATYSLVVFLTNMYSRSATVYQGLTRANPILTLASVSTSGGIPSSYAGLAGKVTGGLGFKAGSKAGTLMAVTVPKAVSYGSSFQFLADPTTGAYSTNVSWYGADPVTATLHALQFTTDINGKITAYGGYGKQNVNLVKQNVPVPVPDPNPNPNPNPGPPAPIRQDLALDTLSTGSLTGAISWPNGLSNPQYGVATVLYPDESNLFFPLLNPGITPSSSIAASSVNQLVPLIAGAKFLQYVGINAQNNNGPSASSTIWKLMTPGTPTDFVIPAPISLNQPAADTSGVTSGSNFSWSAYTGGIHILNISPDFSVSPPANTKLTSLQIITTSSSIKIPDLSAYDNFVLSAASKYTWNVQGVAPYSSVDAATDVGGLMIAPGFGGSGSGATISDGGFSTSPTRPFTTAP
jgi:hypothetical protein